MQRQTEPLKAGAITADRHPPHTPPYFIWRYSFKTITLQFTYFQFTGMKTRPQESLFEMPNLLKIKHWWAEHMPKSNAVSWETRDAQQTHI